MNYTERHKSFASRDTESLRYFVAVKTTLTGANALTWTLKAPFLTVRGLPTGRPRRSTVRACLISVPSGKRTLTAPDWPAY